MDPSGSMKRRNLETQCDLISDLPTDALHKIMEWLPLKDAARMSLLSHKWLGIWTSIPHLVFDVSTFRSLPDLLSYFDNLNRILLQHEGPIIRFSMKLPPLTSFINFASWISYLSRNGLREFSLYNGRKRLGTRLSSHLFSCSGLEKLKLSSCCFSLLPNFTGFAKLASLELHRFNLSERDVKKLIANCPVLKKLFMTKSYAMENMNIVIDAPSLQNLILDFAFKSLELKSCENLVSASIYMKLVKNSDKANLSDVLKVLARSSKLETLTLSGLFCKILFKERSLHSIFEGLRNLEFLALQMDNLDDFSSLFSCMQNFSSIEILKISVKTSVNLDARVLEFNPDCTLNHLRCAIVIISSGTGPTGPELKLIEFLLACSPVLEKLTVSYSVELTQSNYSKILFHFNHTKILFQLNRFRRASQKVEVICQ